MGLDVERDIDVVRLLDGGRRHRELPARGVDGVLQAFAAQRWELVTASQSVSDNNRYRWAMCFKRAVY